MRKMFGIKALTFFGLALAVFGTDARATYYTETVTAPQIPLTRTDFNDTTASLAGKNPFQIQQFDATKTEVAPPKGQTAQLLAVGLTLTYRFENTLSMRFDNVSTIQVAASGTMHLNLTGIKDDLVGAPTFSNSSGPVTSTTADMFSKFVTLPTAVTTGTSKMAYTQANPEVLNAFIGPGVVKLPVLASATSSFTTSSGNGRGSSDTLALASISVIYFYTFVPEPSSFVLAGLGGIGLVTAYRARVRRKD